MESSRELEVERFWEAWNNFPLFSELPPTHRKQLVTLCEEGLYSYVRERYLKTHAELAWNQKFIDLYSSIGAGILYNLDLNSSVNTEWLTDTKADITKSLPYRAMIGYLVLYTQLKNPKVRDLIRSLMPDLVDPYYMSGMSGEQANPDLNVPYSNMIKERGARVLHVTYSTMWECSNCHTRKTKDTSRQTRSLDETNTVLRECLGCHKRWRPAA